MAKLELSEVFGEGDSVNQLHHCLCRSAHWRKTLEQRVPWVLSGADLGANVLETGPGPGLTTDILRSRVPHLTAIETDPRLAQSLSSRLRDTNVEVVAGDATAMPFRDGVFSGCAAFTMLHHVPSRQLQDKLLCEVWRVLKPGRVSVGSDTLQSFFMRMLHMGDTFVPLNPDTFAKRLEAAGFAVLELEKTIGAFRFYARRPVG
jgi:SAM-dependent methyltransferase